MSRRWPFPGDLPVDRARQVCHEYRRALRAVDPDTCEIIDGASIAAGETWVSDAVAVETADDLVTVPRAAELVGRSPRWAYLWASEHPDRIRSTGPIRVRLGDVQEAVAHERARRAHPSRGSAPG